MSEGNTTISIKKPIRDELRRYKAEYGLSYDEAIVQLLAEADWIEDEDEITRDNV